MIRNTKTKVSVDGANQKCLVRYGDRLAVKKRSIQSEAWDNFAEVMIYRLAEILGVECCKVILSKDGDAVSVFEDDYQNKQDFAKLGIRDPSFEEYLDLVTKYRNDEIVESFFKVMMFDLMTRQLDRNPTNIALCFSNRKPYRLYPLYDNGLSLFSTTDVRSAKSEWMTPLGGSRFLEEVCCIEYCRRGYRFLDSWKLECEDVLRVWADIPDVENRELIAQWVVDRLQVLKKQVKLQSDGADRFTKSSVFDSG